jgi:hypothetical protein
VTYLARSRSAHVAALVRSCLARCCDLPPLRTNTGERHSFIILAYAITTLALVNVLISTTGVDGDIRDSESHPAVCLLACVPYPHSTSVADNEKVMLGATKPT